MNRRCSSCILVFFLCMIIPAAAGAEQFSLKISDQAVVDYLADVPCIVLSDTADNVLSVERSEGVVRVVDGSGVAYSSSTLNDAVDGYLRLRGVCVVKDVLIKGHVRISPDAIRFRIKTAKGDILHKEAVKKDIEEIYAMGYFEKCDATFEDNTVVFMVNEYPVIMSIEVKGNEEVKEQDILDAIGLKKFDILNTRMLKTGTDRIKDLYRQRGYYNVDVSTETPPVEGGIKLIFTITENKQLYIEDIAFDGNEHISASKLKGAMETKTRWLLGLFGHEGAYIDAMLDTDLLRIEQYYADNGYMQAKVGRPKIDIRENDGIYITIPVSEGPLFTMGAIDVAGDLILPREKLLEAVDLEPGDTMGKTKIQQAIERVRDIYMDKGYAYVQIKPESTEEEETKIGLTFRITQGKPVTIDTIQIRGNTKTRDKVIRRELEIDEGGTFSSTAIKDSKDNLGRLGYFSSTNIDPVPKSDSTMSLLVDVEETTTGAFSFGFAYSTEDGPMATTSLSEINLLGRGYKAKGSIEYGPEKKNFTVSFEDPWLFDHNLSLGVGFFNLEKEYTYYTKKSNGGNIRLSYPLIERFRHSITYSYENVLGLYDIDEGYEYYLTEEEIEGGVTSSIINSIYRNTTNDYFRPTRGSDIGVALEYAGLGGDYHFTRATASAAQFFPIWGDKLALMLKVRWGTVNPAQGDTLPEYERFDLGGLSSIRGFKYGEVGPQDSLGNFIGGRRMVVMNTEMTFPMGIPGLYGVVFHDEGNGYEKRIDLTNLKKSYGAGIRWVTPMGPLRLEYARVINPEEWESPSRWDFSIGAFF
ncbi:MAG TPA: outer membrane protein assembly factor BamA [Deltaproteobacteria bacterium]|nr:outer membrane protein assembly factor BamA [Deltaproteobacteria bacterium]HXK47305.1 outer membrane protein assembly factor BamA [Deltaproteobacteria bacterium]